MKKLSELEQIEIYIYILGCRGEPASTAVVGEGSELYDNRVLRSNCNNCIKAIITTTETHSTAEADDRKSTDRGRLCDLIEIGIK